MMTKTSFGRAEWGEGRELGIALICCSGFVVILLAHSLVASFVCLVECSSGSV